MAPTPTNKNERKLEDLLLLNQLIQIKPHALQAVPDTRKFNIHEWFIKVHQIQALSL